jgi:DNA-binding LacI/PurR family transcriptional regulator
MRDVASAAGVSPTTASMILGGKDATFPEETRQRVHAAARGLGYRVDRIARNLVRQRSEMIGVVIEFIDNPFLSGVAAYLNRSIHARGYRALFEVTELNADHATLQRATEALQDWRVDGMLHWWNESYGLNVTVAATGTPTVYFGSAAPNDQVDSVFLDDYAGARLAISHLLEQGHRRIGHLSRKASIHSARTRAVLDVVREAGLPAPLLRECPSESAEEARAFAYEIASLPDRPTALFCHNDVMAFGAFRGLRDAGLRIPQDISLVGYDDSWASRYTDPSLTTVVFPSVKLVDIAVDFLFRRIAKQAEAPQRQQLTGALIVRGSTAPPNQPKR